jgi:hypothetical protein
MLIEKDWSKFSRWGLLIGEPPMEVHSAQLLHFCTDDSIDQEGMSPCGIPKEGELSYSFKKTVFFEVFDWGRLLEVFDIPDYAVVVGVGAYLQSKFDEGQYFGTKLACRGVETYTKATGIVGVTGDPITPEAYLDEYTENRPFMFDTRHHTAKFTSLLEVQMVIMPDCGPMVAPHRDLGFVITIEGR